MISGEYFGWSYGWGTAGTLGFLVTALMVATMYTCFIFSFTELTTAIPHAGGPFAYSRRAFGEKGGLIAGIATLIEFVFAPPAIAMAIGAYLNVQYPGLDPKIAAVGAYFVFMTLNILGVSIAATFELVVTVLAVAELLVFMGVVAPGFSFSNFVLNGWSGANEFTLGSIPGIFAAIPFAIWFFLAIEGAAMAAEEAKDPKRTIPRAYVSGILTLVFLAIGVMVMAGGVGDWRQLSNINDPLPQAMKAVVGNNSSWMHMLVWIGLLAWWRVSTDHPRLLATVLCPRPRRLPAEKPGQAVALPDPAPGDSGWRRDRHRGDLQRRPGQPARHDPDRRDDHHVGVRRNRDVHHQHAQPVQTAQNRTAPGTHLPRPGYPVVPAIALFLAVVCLVAMAWFNTLIGCVFLGFMAAGYLYFQLTAKQRADAPADAMLEGI